MCGPALVPENVKDDIAANAAIFHRVTESPFGPDDEIGMLNLITPKSMRKIMNSVDPGTVFDLSVDYFIGMPSASYYGDPPFQIWMSHTPAGTVVDNATGAGSSVNSLVSYSGDCISMYTHCGTHVDTFPHFGYEGKIWNGYSEEHHLGSRHWVKGGAEKHPPIIARGILIDIPPMLGVEVLPESYGIGAKDIREALARQGTELRKGDVALVRTGRMSLWPDPATFIPREPGLNREGAEFLAQAGVVAVGADNLAIEQKPSPNPDNYVPVHTYLLAEAGVPLIEMVDLEVLSQKAVYEFGFIAACLRIRGSTASPMRPLAMPLRD